MVLTLLALSCAKGISSPLRDDGQYDLAPSPDTSFEAMEEFVWAEDMLGEEVGKTVETEALETLCNRGNLLGKFQLSITETGGSFRGEYLSGPDPRLPEAILQDGPCTLYKYTAPEGCASQCADESYCQSDGSCLGPPKRLDVGTISLTGVDPAVDISADAELLYYTLGELFDWLPPDGEMTLSAAGGSGIPPFELTAWGVEPLTAGQQTIEVGMGDSLTVHWEPAKSSSEVMVMLRLDIDYHAMVSPYAECQADDADGGITVPATIMDELYGLGHTGLGTYTELDHLFRFTRSEVALQESCAELTVFSDSTIQVVVVP